MLKSITLRTVSAVTVLMLGACSWMQQPAAPVVAGNAGTTVPADSDSTAPYSPSDNTAPTPAPAVQPAPVAAPVSTGTYVPSYAPVDIRAATHTVVRGDTVYNISKRYQISQDDLRTWNNIVDNNIHVGQVLRVKPAGYVAPATIQTAAAPVQTANPQPTVTPTTSATAATPAATAGGTRTVSGIVWQRPTAGQVITQFGGSSKGIDIAGNAGQAVVSAADGKVVYAGSGLRGYGNLVIVQHTPTFLTAYGHNQSLLVSEGQSVKRGQTIARMGNSDADRTKLHFEVRQNGKPVNPTAYIPN